MRKIHVVVTTLAALLFIAGCEGPPKTTEDPTRTVGAPPAGSVSGGTLVTAANAAAAAAPAAAPEGEPAAEGVSHHGQEGGSQAPSKMLADGNALFGKELTAGTATVALADILKDPAKYDGKVVKTEGEVTQVCKAMGCWMEIRGDAKSPEVHVAMAGHSFFLPKEVAGHHATIEGPVKVAVVDEAERKHLESEGSKAASNTVSISATTVVVAKFEQKPAADSAKTN